MYAQVVWQTRTTDKGRSCEADEKSNSLEVASMTTVASGLEGIVVAESSLSLVDGENGKLYYRGYDVPELAARCSFEEVAHLLWYGALPTRRQLESLKVRMVERRALPEPVMAIIRMMPKNALPMEVLRTAVSAMSAFDPLSEDTSDEALDAKAITLTARFPTILAAFHRLRHDQEPLAPRADLDHAANFLYMFSGQEPDRRMAKALDTYLVLLADHGFNASTFTARQATSTLTDTYSAVTAAIGTLKGPLHGGAPVGVYQMLQEIGTPDKAEEWFKRKVANRERIMGIGHRVYKVVDPRATVLREHARELTLSTGNPVLYAISRKVELLALAHPYFQQRRLYTNVDYYSVAVHASLGIPVDLMTPLFAMSRVVGWTAHIKEQLHNNRLIRPRAQYVGPRNAIWLPIDQREEGVVPVAEPAEH